MLQDAELDSTPIRSLIKENFVLLHLYLLTAKGYKYQNNLLISLELNYSDCNNHPQNNNSLGRIYFLCLQIVFHF